MQKHKKEKCRSMKKEMWKHENEKMWKAGQSYWKSKIWKRYKTKVNNRWCVSAVCPTTTRRLITILDSKPNITRKK